MAGAAIARIDLSALRHNLSVIRRAAPKSKVMAVIKADGYGHGLLPIAHALSGVDGYAVAHLEEGIALRQAGVTQPVLLLQGVASAEELRAASDHRLTVCLFDNAAVDLIEDQRHLPISAWVKFDTGLHRLGFPWQEAASVMARLRAHSHLRVDCVMSHFAASDHVEAPSNTEQLERFQTLSRGWDLPRSMANTAAILRLPTSHFDWVRPGISLYGISPFGDSSGSQLGLRSAMRLSAKVIAVNPLKRGETVGYSGRWRASHDTHIAVVAIGYGDGYPRHAQDGTPVVIEGHRYPLAGRVSMDMITVDIGPTPAVKIGDEAELWGPQLPIEEVAQSANTIPYELTCRLTPRVLREYENR